MLFAKPPVSADDVRAFCARFNEGLRVEYKSNLDESVRKTVPKIVSSFANSRGGVLILGVRTINGVPQTPIEGFEPPVREEIPLTIEAICITNLYPEVFPKIHQIPSDVEGRTFVVVEVDESIEAPHAIENSTLVYVRTGSASNPYQLADVDSVIQLVRRRENPLRTRELLIQRVHDTPHLNSFGTDPPKVSVTICPVMPKGSICSTRDCWEFLDKTRPQPFLSASLRRVNGGVTSFYPGEYGGINTYGVVFGKRKISAALLEGKHPYLRIDDVLSFCARIYWCAAKFLESVGYRGNISAEIRLENFKNQPLPFFNIEYEQEIEQYRSCDTEIVVSDILASENLRPSLLTAIPNLFAQLCWSLWQGGGDFPEADVKSTISSAVAQMNLR